MREQRKLVTVLFADVVGSTELASQRDPEVVRALMSRYFKRIGEISAAYGGTVEKFAGDAAMVVFGVPTVHDDDAERAVRAALEIRDGSREVAVRVGVNTGEAVTELSEDRQFMVSGDAVNVAARLQQGAEAGEVVVGPTTYELTRHVIDYEPREPIAAKGKPAPVAVQRAMRARSEVPTQVRGVPGLHAELVGRDRELRLLLDTFARVAEDRSPHVFTVVGAAGIGKSRLVGEALQRLSGTGARVLRGRCLPYGRGITYWPFIEMLRHETGIQVTDEREAALRKLDRWLGELLVDVAQRPAMRARLSVVLGFDTAETAMADIPADQVEREVAWAIRLCVASLAKNSPLIVVVDDLQWAEPPVMSLLDQLAERVVDVPLLILCVARPEFLERPGPSSAGKANSTTITLNPLTRDETATLISRLLEIDALPEELRRQIVDRSAGTPLFCEEFLHMLIDENVLVRQGASWHARAATETIRVPEGINAVLAARLDLLPDAERGALQAASVVGQRFRAMELQALLGIPEIDEQLNALRRKGLVAGGDGTGEEFHFRHLLIRDAAYASLPKSGRATFHDRFRAVLETTYSDPQQITEIVAYHAERAYALSSELGLDEALVVERARHAIRWLFAMAERVRMRHDEPTLEVVLDMLRSATAVLPGDEDPSILPRLKLLEAQLKLFRADYLSAREAAAEAATLGEAADMPRVVATARLIEAWLYNWVYETGGVFQEVVERAIEACRRAGDLSLEIEARHVATNVLWGSGDLEEFVRVNEELLDLADSIGDHAHSAWITARLASPEANRGNVDKARRYDAQAEALAARYGLRNVALRVMFDRASDALDTGDLPEAERLYREFYQAATDAGAAQQRMGALRFLGYTLVYAGRPAEAAEVLDQCLELSLESGERWNRSEALAMRARAALDSREIGRADEFIAQALGSLREDDVTANSEVHTALGLIRSAQHRDGEAEAALRRGLSAIADTGYCTVSIPAGIHLALFLARRAKTGEARAVGSRSRAAAEQRGWHLWDGLLAQLDELTAGDS